VVAVGDVALEVSKYGRPIIYLADWYYRCLPGTAVPEITLKTRNLGIAFHSGRKFL
jgi:hypothetical protein